MAKIKARARWIENILNIVDNTRTHSIVLDARLDQGGNDSGPTALELCLMSLAGCAISIFADVAKKSGIPLTEMKVEVEAEKFPDLPIISNVNLKVQIAGKARQALLEAAWRRTEANCPVLFIFRESMPVKVETEITSE